jgi:predicted RNase H-like nuclease
METFVGVAWTGEGWLAAVYDEAGFRRGATFEEIGGLWATHAETAERICVGVPVGLPSEGSDERAPDPLVRSHLPDHAVPRVPVRAAVHKQTRRAAARVNERRTGQPLDERAWSLAVPIRQVDSLLRHVAETPPVFREAHPELCYRAFAGAVATQPRGSAAGYAQRLNALEAYEEGAAIAVRAVARAAADTPARVADALDAVALGLTAAPGPYPLRALPEKLAPDEAGLPLGVVYRGEDALS